MDEEREKKYGGQWDGSLGATPKKKRQRDQWGVCARRLPWIREKL
jgi:hypothetical protein